MKNLDTLAVTTYRVFGLHLSILLHCEWWGGDINNHSINRKTLIGEKTCVEVLV